MAKFTLSWEEFLDTYSSHLPERNWVKPGVLVLAAMGSGALGIVLSGRAEERTPLGSIFFVIALGLFAWAYWERSAFPHKRSSKELELRAAYNKHFSKELTFTFDDAQWFVETETTSSTVLWAGLQTAHESPLNIALWSWDHLVIVPKRILATEQVQSLRRLALGNDKNMTSFHTGFFDYVFSEIPSFWRRNSPSSASYLAVLCLLFVVVRNLGAQGAAILLGMGLGSVALSTAILAMQFIYFSATYLLQWKTKYASWESEFSDRGARTKLPRADTFLDWTHFTKFRETGRCFLLYHDHQRYYLLVKKCLFPDEQAALRQLFKSKLKEE